MKKRLSFALSITLTQSILAGTMGDLTTPAFNYVATLSGGPIWQSAGKTQTIYLAPDIEKSYVSNKSTTILAEGELFLGTQSALNSVWFSQIGLAVASTGKATLRGEIWDDALPEFNNYIYRYYIQHTHIALKGKVLAEKFRVATPWISASLGVGFNRASGFTNIPTIFEAIPNEPFSPHTKSSFTYTIGVGIQKTLSDHCKLGVGYEFADWGKSQLGRATQQTLGEGLSLQHLYTNGLLFNLTYLMYLN